MVHKEQDQTSTKTTIPFFKNTNLDYADFVGFLGDHAQTVGWIIFVLVTIFVVTAVSNGCLLYTSLFNQKDINKKLVPSVIGMGAKDAFK